MNWFGRKAAQGAARPALSRVYGAWSAPAPLSWEAQVRAGYLGNAIVQRSVRLVAEAAGAAPVAASDPALAALVTATSGGQGLVDPARSVQQQAFRAFLCNQKGGRCDHRFERHQAVEVRRQLKRLVREGARSRLPSLSGRAGRLPAGVRPRQ